MKSTKKIGLVLVTAVSLGCGGGNNGSGANEDNGVTNNGESFNNGAAYSNNGNNGTQNSTSGEPFVPEVEEFVIENVAATDSYVFVPNSSEEGTTVARIDGRDLSVTPIPVGLNPTDVVAFEHPEAGAVAVVLVEGTGSAAVIRADESFDNPVELVRLLAVPSEVNRLAASPDGRHVLAWIDPNAQLPADSSVASLQAAALIRVGESNRDDRVFDLSVTRLIRDIEFTDDGSEAFIVGREGVNRLELASVSDNAFVPPLPLDLSADAFPPTDVEVEVSGDGSFLVVRSSAFAGVAIYGLDAEGISEPRILDLAGIPTDIDLLTAGGDRVVIATVRSESSFATIDVDAALADPAYVPPVTEVGGATAGLAQLTPDQERALFYSSLPLLPELAIYGFDADALRVYPLRNKIRSVAVSPDSRTAVVVHDRLDPAENDGLAFFQTVHGLTLVDLETGYRRPIVLQAEPVEIVMTDESQGAAVFVLMEASDTQRQGIMRIDLRTYRSDFVALARPPRQIGLVAGKVFVAQEAAEGRITFFDAATLSQRTVSGYELNAGID